MLKIAYHPIYFLPLPEKHRFPMEKYTLLPQQLLYEGTCEDNNFFTPKSIAIETVYQTHDKKYVDRFVAGALDKKEIRRIGFPWSKQLVEREFILAGGTVQASKYALENGVAMNIAGGTHHAFFDRGEAFCMLHDQAIAATYLLQQSLATKILIVDLDVHQGNGTAALFKDNPKVFTFSMHGAKNYPFRKEESNLDIALEDQTNSEDYLRQLKNTLPKLLETVHPDFIFYLSGVDVIKGDKLGRLALSLEACKERDRFVLQTCYDYDIPVQVSMGGGYSPDIKTIIEAHANTFRQVNKIYF